MKAMQVDGSVQGMELLSNPQRVQVGRTPHEVVYRRGALTLRRYLPLDGSSHGNGGGPSGGKRPVTPLLMVYALVNRPYILDLLPGRSVVEHFLSGGAEVYLIDWGAPDAGDRDRTLEDYIGGALHDCVQQVRHQSGAEQVSLFGYCQGGTFSAMYTALHPEQVRNLLLLAAPIDFEVDGLLNLWSKKEFFNVDKMVETYGNVPASVLNGAFAMLRPIYNLMDKYVQFSWSLLENRQSHGQAELFCAMEQWIADGIPQPGGVFREFVKGCYQENLLIQNRMKLGQRLVDLRSIRCPVLNIFAEGDHIVPPQSSRAFNTAISSQDKTLLPFAAGGHVGMTIGAHARSALWPKVVDWLVERSS